MSLFLWPFGKATDNQNLPISGGKLYFYLTGTSVPATVYANAILTTPLTNPVVADSYGNFPTIFLDPEIVYRADLTNASGTILDQADPYNDTIVSDFIDDISASTGSNLIGFLQAGSGAVARPLQTKVREIEVHLNDYKQSGESTHDNAFSRVITYLQSVGGGVVRCPQTVSLASTVTIPCDNIVIEGRGRGPGGAGTTITYSGTTGPVFKSSAPTTATRLFCGFRDLVVVATSLTSVKVLIDLKSFQFSYLDRVWTYGSGVDCINVNVEANYGVTEATYNTITDCYFGNFQYGIRIYDGANATRVLGNNRFQSGVTAAYAINAFASSANYLNSVEFAGVGVEQAGTPSLSGIQIGANVWDVSVNSCRFENLITGVHCSAVSAKNIAINNNSYSGCTNNVLNVGANGVTRSGENYGFRFANKTSPDGLTLAWYEEITFTPVIEGTSVAGTGTYTTQTGIATRVGRVVTVAGTVTWNAHTGTGNIKLTGLPWAILNSGGPLPIMLVGENLTFTGQVFLYGVSGTTTAIVYVQTSGAAASPVAIDTAATLGFNFSYQV